MARIFVSYSRRGSGPRWKAALLDALALFARHGVLDVWEDGRIRVSSLWDGDIVSAVAAADLAVLLLTPEALASEYIVANELPLLRARQQEGMAVFPVVCEPCDWQEHPWLGATQVATLPENGQENEFRRIATEIAERLAGDTLAKLRRSEEPPRIELGKLPLAADELIGREQELAMLDLAFAERRLAIGSLVAWGGAGKTALVREWLARLERERWPGLRRVYAWSFYSQGASEDRQASEDPFLASALEWFGVRHPPSLSPWDKGALLADAIAGEPTLLILDGLEPLQYPPGPNGGQLRAPGVRTLLRSLTARSFCVLTTREAIRDLTGLRLDLGNLTPEAGAALLHRSGARRAGAASIPADDPELHEASRAVGGHALTLHLLGRFLARAHLGDIRRRDRVGFTAADAAVQGGHTSRVLAAFERWFAQSDPFGARRIAILRLLGLFDRPADAGCLEALRRPPFIDHLTRADLQRDEEWNETLSFLADFGLVTPRDDGSLDSHPLIREHFATQLRRERIDAWRTAHRRLYDYLRGIAATQPETLAEIEPLYQAVAHGCEAALHQRVWEETYKRRVLRVPEYFPWHRLGAYGEEIAVRARFFEVPWHRPSPLLSEEQQAWLLNDTAFCLQATGRLEEAIEAMRISVRMNVVAGRWADAAVAANNLSEIELARGDIAPAIDTARESVEYGDRSRFPFYFTRMRVTLADALHQAGRREEARALFVEAERAQARDGPPYLYSVLGGRYCDLLLGPAEILAWRKTCGADVTASEAEAAIRICKDVDRRMQTVVQWRQPDDQLVEIATDHLTVARAALYASILDPGIKPARAAARVHVERAVDAFRRSGQQQELPRSLMTRAWQRFIDSDEAGARTDLDEAWQVAERGGMRLHMADVHLCRARLFRIEDSLAAARSLIAACGYRRRNEELEMKEGSMASDRYDLEATVNLGDGQWRPARARNTEANAYTVLLRITEGMPVPKGDPEIRIGGERLQFVRTSKLYVTPAGEWMILALRNP